MKKEFLIFKCYSVDVKNIKCPLQLWEKHEVMFLIISFFAQQVLNIAGSWIETNCFITLTRILTNLGRCRLQIEILKKLILLSKNWPNDLRIRCKSLFNLVKFTKINGDLEKSLNSLKLILKKMKILNSKCVKWQLLPPCQCYKKNY